MEEILKRLGVQIESWVISMFAAVLIVIYGFLNPKNQSVAEKQSTL